MPKVIVTHAVEDIDRWLQGKDARAAEIGSGGGSKSRPLLDQRVAPHPAASESPPVRRERQPSRRA